MSKSTSPSSRGRQRENLALSLWKWSQWALSCVWMSPCGQDITIPIHTPLFSRGNLFTEEEPEKDLCLPCTRLGSQHRNAEESRPRFAHFMFLSLNSCQLASKSILQPAFAVNIFFFFSLCYWHTACHFRSSPPKSSPPSCCASFHIS